MKNTSPARRLKRAAAAQQRRASGVGVPKSDAYAKTEDVNKAFQQLSKNQETLGKLVNQNLGAVATAFDAVDAHQHVMRRILNDIVKGDVVISQDPTNGVDYEWYFTQYNATRAFVFFVAKLVEAHVASLPAGEANPAVNEVSEFEFGGDYVQDQARQATG